MIKIERNNLILFLLFVIALLTVSSCTKPECKNSADCVASKLCTVAKCEKSKCIYLPQRNCCGNGIKDSIENGKPGNKCTCPQDYGKCEGKGNITIGSRTEEAKYVRYYCNDDNQCVFGVDKKEVIPQTILDSINVGFFKVSSIVRYNNQFDINKDNFEFSVTLDDVSKDLVLPVHLTRIKLLFNSQYARVEQLIADKDLSIMLNGIGEQATISTKLNLGYRPQELEDSGSLKYSIDYMYTKRVLSGRTINGTNLYNDEIVRATFTAPQKPVFFVRSE